MLLTRCVPLAVAIALCPIGCAQYTSAKVVFKNPGSYAQADLEAVAQVHAKEKVSSAVVQAAAQRLIDTGYFDDVGATFEGPAAAINVVFTLKPLTAAQMTAVSFDNFVWLAPQERDAIVHDAAPLFAGRLPDAGNQPEAIAAALQAALGSKGVQATVVHEEREPSLEQPIRAIVYKVEQPAVRIHALKLRGVAPALAPEVQKVAGNLRNARYHEGLARPNTADELLLPYLDAGYVNAKLKDTHVDVAETTPTTVGVDVSGSVSAGEPYRVSALAFAGTSLIAADAVMPKAKLHTGDIASHKLLLETLQPIDAAYRHLGYMDVFVDPGAKLDTTANTVSYSITVVPGEQYHLRSATPNGLSPAALADFKKGWRMTEGALYDSSYVSGFMKNNTALRALQDYSCAYQASADPQTHLVDLTLNCYLTAGH